MKKIAILIICLIVTGCFNYKELNDYAIVTGMAIDLKEDKYEVTILISNGTKKEDNNAQVSVASGVGDTVYTAIKDIGLSTPKEIYLSHLSVLVINEDIAKKGLNTILDFLMREPQSHQNFYMVIAKDCKAKDSLSILTPQSDYPSQNIASNLKATELLQGKVTDSKFNNFVNNLLDVGINPITNSIKVIGDEEKATSSEEQQKSVASAFIKISDIAIFKKDKLVGWANQEESIGINMLIGDINNLFFDVECNNGKIIISGTDYKIKQKVDKNKITIDIEAKGKISEAACKINLEDPNVIKQYEKKAEERLYQIINKGLNKAKKLNTDIFGYGNKIYKKYPKYYATINDWDSEFSKLNVDININYELTEKGSLEQTLKEVFK